MIELGSSDAPSIMGCGFQTPHALWLEKLGLIERQDDPSEIMDAGTRLQGPILQWWCEREGWHIVKEQPTMYHPRVPWARATPDGLLVQYDKANNREVYALAEIKCVVGQPPPVPRVSWVIQTIHQRWVCAASQTEVDPFAPMYLIAFGGLRLEWWEIPWHSRAEQRVVEAEQRFLDMLERQEPPPLRAEDASTIHRLWPWSRPETRRLTAPEMVEAAQMVREGQTLIAQGEEMKKLGQAKIQEGMQEADAAVLPDGTRCLWRTQRRKSYTVEEKAYRVFKLTGGEE